MLDRIKIDRLDLRAKLIIAFVLIAALVAVTGAIGYTSVATVDEEAHIIAEDGQKMDAAAETIIAMEQQQSAVQAAQLGEENAQQRFEDATQHFNEESQRLQESELRSQQKERFSTLTSQHEEYNALADEFFEARQNGDTELAAQKADKMESLRAPMEEQAHAIEQSAQADLESQVEIADSTTQTAQMEILGLTVASFIIAIFIGLFVASRISTPIQQLSEASRAMSKGDLTVEVEEHVEDDEIGRMVETFSEMQSNIKGVVSQIETASRGLKQGDLSWEFESSYPGQYGEIVEDLEAGADELAGSFDEIQAVSDDLQQGTMDQSIDADRPGQYGEVLRNLATGTSLLSESLTQVLTTSQGLKDGRLDQDIDTDKPGSYGQILASLDAGVSQVNESLVNVQQITDEVAGASEKTATTAAKLDDASDEVAASVEELQQASKDVAESIQEISTGADEQSNDLQRVANEMNNLSAAVEYDRTECCRT